MNDELSWAELRWSSTTNEWIIQWPRCHWNEQLTVVTVHRLQVVYVKSETVFAGLFGLEPAFPCLLFTVCVLHLCWGWLFTTDSVVWLRQPPHTQAPSVYVLHNTVMTLSTSDDSSPLFLFTTDQWTSTLYWKLAENSSHYLFGCFCIGATQFFLQKINTDYNEMYFSYPCTWQIVCHSNLPEILRYFPTWSYNYFLFEFLHLN